MLRIVSPAPATGAPADRAAAALALRIVERDWRRLGQLLEPFLSRWPHGDRVGDWLRRDLALPRGRGGADYAALVLLRLGDDPQRWRELEQLGEPGRALAEQLRLALAEPTPSPNRGRVHELIGSLGAIAGPSTRTAASALEAELRTAIGVPPQREDDGALVSTVRAEAAARAWVRPVEPVRALPAVSVASLATSLAYGGSRCLAIIEEEMRREPDGRLAFALRDLGYRADGPRGEALGDLLLLLTRHRTDPSAAQLDGSSLVRTFGPVGERLLGALDELARVPRPAEPNLLALGQMVTQLTRRLPRQQAKLLVDQLVRHRELIPRSNPVLDRVLAHVPRGALAGQGLVAVQHMLPSVCNLVEACIARGMRPQDIHILSTPYNCNPLVAAYLELLGVHVQRSMSFGLDARSSEDLRVRELTTFLTSAFGGAPPPKGWRLLDDGGLLHVVALGAKDSRMVTREAKQALAERMRTHQPHIRSGTEQTTRGLTELRKTTVPFPVFTVANQPGKREEAQVIGWALAGSMLREIRQAGRLEATRLLNVSAGQVGLAAATHLRALDFATDVYDHEGPKRQQARERGFPVLEALPASLDAYELVLSSTGRRALHLTQLLGFQGLVGSGSSGVVEFDGQLLGPLGGQLNRAHPLNFTGTGFERLSPEQIGGTIGLLFAGICSDATGLAPGEHPPDLALQKVAHDAWIELGGDKTPKLERAPPFSLPRPDELSPAPTHDEWMTYLANLPRAVSPRPNAEGFVEGVYFFAGEKGEVRCVDTRSGVSFDVPGLARVPERVAAGGFPKENYPLVLFEPTAKPLPTVRIAHVRGASVELSREYAVDRLVSHYHAERAHTRSQLLGTVTTQSELGLVFEQGDQYLLFWPGRWDMPERVPKPFGQDTLAVMHSSKSVYCLHRTVGAVRVLGETAAPPPVAQPIVNVRQFLRARPYNDLLAVGSSASGKPAVGLLTTSGWHAYELPDGAIVHDVYWPGDFYRFCVTYTLPGEPVEPETMKEVEFMPLGARDPSTHK